MRPPKYITIEVSKLESIIDDSLSDTPINKKGKLRMDLIHNAIGYTDDIYNVAPFDEFPLFIPMENKLQKPDVRRLFLVRSFIEKYNITPLWCNSSQCACLGCVNKVNSVQSLWRKEYPKLEFLTEKDIDDYNRSNEKRATP